MNRQLLNALTIGAMSLGVLLLSHYGLAVVAVLLVALPELVRWLRAGRSLEAARELVPRLTVGLSAVALISLTQSGTISTAVLAPVVQVAVAIGYAVWLAMQPRLQPDKASGLVAIMVMQFATLCSLFLAASFGHWQAGYVGALVWVSSYAIAAWYLYGREEPGAGVLAATWALVAAETAWVFAVWSVQYIVVANVLIVPQAALIISGLGYCFASIYMARSQRKLSRNRLIEYVIIMSILVAIVVAGTHWTAT